MRAAAIDPSRSWLIGGGLREPLNYGELVRLVSQAHETVASCVAEELVRLTRAFWREETLQLEEPTFSGEGQWTDRRREGTEPDARFETHETWLRGSAEIVMTTSGSTGAPKIIRQPMSNLARGVVVGPRHAADIWGFAYNPSHIAGVQVYLQALANGNTIVNLWRVDADEVVQRCRSYRVTHLSATPTFYRLLLATNSELPALRSISMGGEVADARLVEQLRSRFPAARVHNIYASTEAGTVLTSDGVEFTVPASMATAVRIVDGELHLQASLVAKDAASGEWYHTGDFVEVTGTEPLRFRIVGRAQQWINVGGEKVNPVEVEALLTAQPGVALARVSSRRNSITGEMLVAEIVSGDPIDEADLRATLARRLPPHKVPRIIRRVDQLPLTRTGKVARHG